MKLFGNSSGGSHGAPNNKNKSSNTSNKNKVFDEATVQVPREITKQKAAKTAPQHTASKKQQPESKAAKTVKGKKAIIALCVVVVVVLGIVIGYSIWEKPPEISNEGTNLQTPAVTTPEPEPTPSGAEETPVPETQQPVETEQVEKTPEPVVSLRKEECYTFLVAASDVVGTNTDALLVGRFDVKEGTLSVISIPRDTLVNVGWGVKKINTILGGYDNDPEKLKEYVSDLLGFKIDCYAIIDIGVVEKIVDCIGGVYYTVPVPMDYEDPLQGLSIHIAPGYQLLDGKNAVKVLRFRSGYANGDLGRVKTQQEFLMAMASQMLSLGNIPNLSEILNIVDKHVQTDLSVSNLAYFAREFLTMDKSNITFMTQPGEAIYIRGGSYYQISIDEWIGVINEHLNPFNDEIAVSNLDILNVAANGEVYSTTGEHIPLYGFYDFFNQ